jgi:hypothetical protein
MRQEIKCAVGNCIVLLNTELRGQSGPFDTGIALMQGGESCDSPCSTGHHRKGKDKNDSVFNSATYHEDISAIRNFRTRCEWSLYIYIHSMVQQPLVGKDLLIMEALRSYSDAPQSVGLLWTSDEPVVGTSA